MRLTFAIPMIVCSLALAGAASADPAQTSASAATKPAKKPPSPDEVICTQEQVTGSIFPKKVCMTRAQRAKLEDEHQSTTINSHGDDRTIRSETP